MVKPVDELGDIRAEQKKLAEREKELRAIIIADKRARQGRHYAARVTTQTSTKTKWKELAISLGATEKQIEEFSSETTVEFVRLTPMRERAPVIVDHQEVLDQLREGKLVS